MINYLASMCFSAVPVKQPRRHVRAEGLHALLIAHNVCCLQVIRYGRNIHHEERADSIVASSAPPQDSSIDSGVLPTALRPSSLGTSSRWKAGRSLIWEKM